MSETVVLIIDPDETSTQFLAQLLRQRGFKVLTSTSGRDGFLRASDYPPGVIIIDAAIADVNPRELIKTLQGNRHLSQVPVIAVSARYDAAEMQALMEAGCVEYYAKSGSAALALVEALPRLVAESLARANKDDRGMLRVKGRRDDFPLTLTLKMTKENR